MKRKSNISQVASADILIGEISRSAHNLYPRLDTECVLKRIDYRIERLQALLSTCDDPTSPFYHVVHNELRMWELTHERVLTDALLG